jgi:hypothetical protein
VECAFQLLQRGVLNLGASANGAGPMLSKFDDGIDKWT